MSNELDDHSIEHDSNQFEQRLRQLEDQDRRLTYEQRASRAFAHGVRVRSEAACSVPRPKIVYVQSHQKRRVVFLPRATLLHRCDNSSGCCATDRQRCVAIDWSPVSLYFFTISMDGPNGNSARSSQTDLHLDEGDLMDQLLAEDRSLMDRLNGKRKRHSWHSAVANNDRRKRKLTLTTSIDSDEPLLGGRWVASALAKKGQFRQAVERLVFVNHTKCACIDKTLLI